ncbi:T9SS type A sorting domain-containing protein [Flavobacterium sp.]|uniref:type IX secretion system anionic LPS delivery protein PorZ n=1 Tax=Flavobacterium sp. TaxID=239 RepID=UPI0028BD32FD|nr:T9SS type A sorting domain-containing protein [Flavobacterium sp.]
MKKSLFFCLFLFSSVLIHAQQQQLWKSYFSYTAIKDLSPRTDKVYAAAENVLFSKNLNSEEIKTTTSVDGFKAATITAMHHSEAFNKTLVGNSNGLLIVINETDGTIINVVDIVNKQTIPQNKKRINDIYEHDGKVYLSCDYGISVFDLSNNQFGDTYFIGPAGEEVVVYQTTVLNNYIYAVTSIYGIRRAELSNPFLVDFSQWTVFDAGYWSGIETFQNELVASNSSAIVYRYNGTSFNQLINVGQSIVDLEAFNDRLSITSNNHVYVYDNSFMQLAHITQIPDISSNFSCATVIGNQIFIGTINKGLHIVSADNISAFENITPNGPYLNDIVSVKKNPNKLWAVYGDYTQEYDPYPLDEYDISHYTEETGWSDISYSNLYGAKSLSRIALHPTNQNLIYASSFFSGLLKIEGQDNDNITLFNQSNTGPNGLESLTFVGPDYIDVRVNGPAFDRNNNLWMTVSRVNRAIKVLKSDGNWQSYSLENITAVPIDDSYASLVVDKNNTKWIPSFKNGLIAFNENLGNKFILFKEGEGNGNLPVNDVRCLAIDNRNQLWIGTFDGLRIIPSVDRFLNEDSLESNSIIIMEDGLAQELFYQQSIWDIAVDGSNRKWVAIAEAGAFLLSPNGQETIYHFTMENSPLPSNNINDIEIDEVTGEVFFATDKGMVSFKGVATKPADDLANVYVYPNPVRPGYNGTVKISGLISDANIKITDIEGNLVYETTSEGGTIEWDTRAFGKHKVASGVYMIFIASEDGTETAVKKVMVVR